MQAILAGTITQHLPVPQLGAAPPQAIRAASDLIRQAKRPALLVGARGADPRSCESIRNLVAATGFAVVETFQGAGVVSRELEDHYLGRVGLFRNQPGDLVVAATDILIAIGYDAIEYDPALWNLDASRTIVHIDSVPADIDTHYQPSIELRGDIGSTVSTLTETLSGLTIDADFDREISAHRDTLASIDATARQILPTEAGLNPAAVVLRLRDELDDDATVACDIGSVYIFMARHFRTYQPRRLLFSNGQQTLGVALPWAMAASLIRPGTNVVSISDDGGFLFSAQELETATRLGLTFTHIILRDNTYDMVGFQEVLKYGRKSGVQLADYDISNYAATFGAHGYRVDNLENFTTTLRHALTEPGPSIIDVPVDYTHNTDLAAHLPDDPFE